MFEWENSVLGVDNGLEGRKTRGRETDHKTPSERQWRCKLGSCYEGGEKWTVREKGSAGLGE